MAWAYIQIASLALLTGLAVYIAVGDARLQHSR
jgi:hypothetical protein